MSKTHKNNTANTKENKVTIDLNTLLSAIKAKQFIQKKKS